jgi:hypothetical protein
MTWYDDGQTIVLYTIKGRWTLDDLNRTTDEFSQTVERVPHYFIIDMREAAGLPLGMLAAEQELIGRYDYNFNVVIGAGRLENLLLTTLNRLGMLTTTVTADSLEAAEARIQQHRRQTGV